MPASGLKLAGWGYRLVARIIDAILIGIISAPFGSFRSNGSGVSVSFSGGRYFMVLVIGIVYTGLMHGLKGKTVGKMVMGLKVVKKGTTEKIEMGPAFVRSIVDGLLGATCILGLLDGLFPLWDKDKQAIHDKAASSQVISER